MIKLAIIVIALIAMFFSVFGFLASFEPAENAIAWRVGHGLLFLCSVLALGWTLRSFSTRTP